MEKLVNKHLSHHGRRRKRSKNQISIVGSPIHRTAET